jgi:nucleotide-binding universal stress UspA family protein
MLPIRTVLYATDFSPSADFAFRVACALARDYGARLIALHVAAPPIVGFGEGVIPPQPEEYEAAVRVKLRQLQPRDPNVPVDHRFVEGDPADEIVRAAREGLADVIVLGTHGRTGLGRLIMGSVAEKVVRRAGCAVLAVKAPTAGHSPVDKPAAEAAGTPA